jgi:hypothetical protein
VLATIVTAFVEKNRRKNRRKKSSKKIVTAFLLFSGGRSAEANAGHGRTGVHFMSS